MLIRNVALLVFAFGNTQASSLTDYASSTLNDVYSKLTGRSTCPTVWASVTVDLTLMFAGILQCNDDARAAIRLAFHDCGTWDQSQGSTGGCDGSIILAGELTRPENNGLQAIGAKLLNLQQKYVKIDKSVTVADIIQYAGAVALVTCPGGPQITTYVGRKDSATPAPTGKLPDVHSPATDLLALFAAKGFSAAELAALIGAHSTSKALHETDIPVGTPQDSTPGLWDVSYYSQTLNPTPGMQSFASDKALAADPNSGPVFKSFVGQAAKWNSAFAAAMGKLSLLGIPSGGLTDCTIFVPKGTGSRRDMLGSSPFYHRY